MVRVLPLYPYCFILKHYLLNILPQTFVSIVPSAVYSLTFLELAFPWPLHSYDKSDIKLHREFFFLLEYKALEWSKERHPPSCLSPSTGGNEVMNSSKQNPDDLHDSFLCITSFSVRVSSVQVPVYSVMFFCEAQNHKSLWMQAIFNLVMQWKEWKWDLMLGCLTSFFPLSQCTAFQGLILTIIMWAGEEEENFFLFILWRYQISLNDTNKMN